MNGADRIGEKAGGAPAGIEPDGDLPRRRHGRRRLTSATRHELAKEKHQRVENTNANSPRAKTKSMVDRGRRAARGGGRWRRRFEQCRPGVLGLRFVDEYGAGRYGGPVFIARSGAKKGRGRIRRGIRRRQERKEKPAFGVGKKMKVKPLTSGPRMSALRRERKARARRIGPAAATGLGP
jgi:hypothetical protein